MKIVRNIAIVLIVIILGMSLLVYSKVQGESVLEIPIQSFEELALSDKSILSTNLETSILDTSELFSDQDLEQVPELDEAIYITLNSDEDVTITEEGIYILCGDVTNTTVKVRADDKAKVQLVLDGVSIINEETPAIYALSSDKVFVTTTDSENFTSVTGNFLSDGGTNLDAVIYSKVDLVLNGIGTLNIISENGNAITSKDDLKITGGIYNITAYEDGLEANDSIRIYDGSLNIDSNKDAIHCENEEDLTLGYIYIANGDILINAADDAIRGNSVVQIDNGNIIIEYCSEGIEGSYIQINDGIIDIYSTNDAINAANKSVYPMAIEVNGGEVVIEMGDGDTDGFDSNGDLIVNAGTIRVTSGMAAFDVDGVVVYDGGVITVDGELIDEIEVQTIGISEIIQSKFN